MRRQISFRNALRVAALSVLLVPTAQAQYRETSVTDGGTLTGRVYFESEFPPAETLQPDRDADTCGIRLPKEQFVVDEGSKGLANVIVRIEGVSSGKSFASAAQQIEQVECRYQPRVSVVRPGEQFEIINQDPILHNVHAYREDETLFNLAQPFQGQASPQSVEAEGIVRIACDVHSWMEAWVLVLDSPYFSLTDANGAFSIGDVPPGEYTVTMWHEALGSSSKMVAVKAGDEIEVEFVIG